MDTVTAPVHVSDLSEANPFETLGGSTICELVSPVSIPTSNQSLAEATVLVGGFIPPGAIHKLTNTGEVPIRLLCCCAPPYSDADTVLTGG